MQSYKISSFVPLALMFPMLRDLSGFNVRRMLLLSLLDSLGEATTPAIERLMPDTSKRLQLVDLRKLEREGFVECLNPKRTRGHHPYKWRVTGKVKLLERDMKKYLSSVILANPVLQP
jgi:hypothetical protein